METLILLLPFLMFVVLGLFLFSGFPVAFGLAGVSLIFGLIGIGIGAFEQEQFFSIVLRIYGENVNKLLILGSALPSS